VGIRSCKSINKKVDRSCDIRILLDAEQWKSQTNLWISRLRHVFLYERINYHDFDILNQKNDNNLTITNKQLELFFDIK